MIVSSQHATTRELSILILISPMTNYTMVDFHATHVSDNNEPEMQCKIRQPNLMLASNR